MKKLILLTVVAALPLTLMAQDDDMYFVPTKENVAKETKNYGMPKNVYYSGSDRSVDDYNRRIWSSVEPIDSAGNDIIDFSAVRGVYPDSTAVSESDDYKYTKRLSRFEGYTSTSDAYWEGYRDGRWASPWYYSSYYPWYDSWYYWNDPWYYGYYGYYSSWYSPWYYGGYYRPWRYRGWYGPRYYARSHYRPSGAGRFHVNHPANTGSRTYTSGNGRFSNGSRFSNGTFGNGSTMSRGSSSSTRSSGGFSGGGSFGGGTRSGGSFGGGGGSFGGGGGVRTGGGGTFSRGR